MTSPEPDLGAEQVAIAAGVRIREFLEDTAVKAALAQIDANAAQAFRAATDNDGRLNAWALMRASEQFQNALRATVENGKTSKIQQGRREARQVVAPVARAGQVPRFGPNR